MGSVQACKALDLVRKAAVLVASLEQLAPHCMEPLMMLMQQLPMLLPDLQHPLKKSVQQESSRTSTAQNAAASLWQLWCRKGMVHHQACFKLMAKRQIRL